MTASSLACSESPRGAFTGAEAPERGEGHAPGPELEVATMRHRTTRRMVRWQRRRCRCWSRKHRQVLVWGCYELAICYVRRRGWAPVCLTHLGDVETVVWPPPAEVSVDEEKNRIACPDSRRWPDAPGGC